MKRILYIISLLLALGWVLGAVVHKTGGLIHILLIISVLAAMQGLILCPGAVTQRNRN